MSEPDATDGSWSELTDDLLGLTEKVRSTYREAARESGPSEDEIRAAFQTLVGAWSQIAGSVGAAISDPAVRQHLKRAANSLMTAVGATLSEVIPTTDPAQDEDEEE